MGGHNKISQKLADYVWELLRDWPDDSCRTVAKAAGVSEATVQRVAAGSHPRTKQRGKPRDSGAYKPRVTLKQVENVIVLFVRGMGIIAIARTTGISVSTIRRILDGQHEYNKRAIR